MRQREEVAFPAAIVGGEAVGNGKAKAEERKATGEPKARALCLGEHWGEILLVGWARGLSPTGICSFICHDTTSGPVSLQCKFC